MTRTGPSRPTRLRRSVLSVPAINRRALEKVHGLDCDAVIFDLEDSVAPEKKAEARANLQAFFAETPPGGRERIIRINAPGSGFEEEDMALVLSCAPDAVLLPKVDDPDDVLAVSDLLDENDAPDSLRIWAMIETPRAILNVAAIADAGRTAGTRLDCLVVGLNDLRKETGVQPLPGRPYLVPWLMQVILAARAYGLDALDSVSNDFKDLSACDAECAQGRAMGFDGKMLIHPTQIDAANRRFAPSEADVCEARSVIAAFAEPAAAGLGVVNLGGRMVERLHLDDAERLVLKAQRIAERKVLP